MMDIPESPPLRSFLISCIFRNVNSSSGSGRQNQHTICDLILACTAVQEHSTYTSAWRCSNTSPLLLQSAARGARTSSAASPLHPPGSGVQPPGTFKFHEGKNGTGQAPGAAAGRAGPGPVPVPRRRCRSRSRSLPPQRPLLAPRGLRRRAGPGRSESPLG